ncbi:hypothetical protein LY90DRAFT_503115 [Neocallimastix californiae]|uniref:Uncharacterized protein n=1 Tax=Neocallimastix californiae TaxID=1754190 RepID=A0A1Y2EQK6_9FUNG|nr:hypothetical protein LY90DRAFT_503115 [Neocallimastix californiae]|eukprot:ORY73574.1 hypothetical protein LY90DRAFT_503115 [Neocallimastix californiae]
MNQDEIYLDITNKILENAKIKIIKEVYNNVLNALSKEQNNELLNDNLIAKVIQSNVKKTSNSNVGKLFYIKKETKNSSSVPNLKEENKENHLNLIIPSVVYFCKNIPNAIEIPKNLIKANLNFLQKNENKYHYFTVKLNHNDKIYFVTYAELNKFTKREIIAIYLNNKPICKDNFPYELKEKYDFF